MPLPEEPVDRLRWASATLLRYFTPRTGKWAMPTGEAWQPALAVETIVDAYEIGRDIGLLDVIEKSFARYRGRRSHFFDDDGWYANTWLRAYDVTGDPKYLDEAVAIFDSLTDGWDATCGGGMWWNKDRTYKNAITNELFLLAAARLYRRTGEHRYRRRATVAWAWFDASGMINDADLVNDGLDSSCANNGGTTWTYNQGVILGALAELWRITGDDDLLRRAGRIADAAMTTLVHPDSGILREPSEPLTSNKDSHVFKGVFAQGLSRLYEVDPRPAYAAFLAANADAVWRAGRHPRKGMGLNWQGPLGWITGATHASACLLLAGLARTHVSAPTPLPRRDGRSYDALAATLAGVGIESRYAGYTGAGYVAGWRREGQSVRFAVDVAAAGTHTLTFRYAAGTGTAYRALDVDGACVVDRVPFVGTGGWDSYSTVSVDVPLDAGARTVSLAFAYAHGSRNYLNLDSLVVTPRTAGDLGCPPTVRGG